MRCDRVKVACVLKSGGDYCAEHVTALWKMVSVNMRRDHLFGCVSDVQVPGVLHIPLIAKLPGKWSMVEAFRVKGPTIAMGLDSIVVGDITPLAEIAVGCKPGQFYLIKSFNRKRAYANGIMIWNGDWSEIFESFNLLEARKRSRMEMMTTIAKLKELRADLRVINDDFPGIYSYKKHCRDGLPDDAKIVLFHGKPRPHQVAAGWVRKKYPWPWERREA